MLMQDLLAALKSNLNGRIRNGELTERNLARRIGMSQAHVHNVLKGARILTAEVADLLMLELNLSVGDLVTGEDLAVRRKPPGRELRPLQLQRPAAAPKAATSR